MSARGVGAPLPPRAECCHNELDATKGRQLPMHIGSPSLHCQYVKSNLGQQVPAANGAAYAMKLMKKQRCAITYFGEGCASEGDIPSALNIAAVHGCPTIFFCRNNGCARPHPPRRDTARE